MLQHGGRDAVPVCMCVFLCGFLHVRACVRACVHFLSHPHQTLRLRVVELESELEKVTRVADTMATSQQTEINKMRARQEHFLRHSGEHR